MQLKLKPDCCPNCGEPPRYLRSCMLCAVPLARHDAHGVSFEPDFHNLYMLRRVAQPDLEKVATLECGGGHRWEASVEEITS